LLTPRPGRAWPGASPWLRPGRRRGCAGRRGRRRQGWPPATPREREWRRERKKRKKKKEEEKEKEKEKKKKGRRKRKEKEGARRSGRAATKLWPEVASPGRREREKVWREEKKKKNIKKKKKEKEREKERER